MQNGEIWAYPHRSAVQLHDLNDSLVDYSFGKKVTSHKFCRVCGVAVANVILDPSAPHPSVEILPINVRTINGLDLLALNVERSDGRSR